MAEFGKEMRKQFILEDNKTTFVNHAACGALPLVVFEHRNRLIREMEQAPDVWFRNKSEALWNENIQAVAEFLGSKTCNIVFVSNTTTGINAVVRSINLKPDDAILVTSWTYFAMKDTCHHVSRQYGVEVLYVDFPFPLQSTEQLVDAYEQMLSKHDNIRLVLLDLITSVPPVLLPLKELIAISRKYGKLILVDGAHGPGHVPLNLEELGADFFTGNLYKWTFAPRGCAVLWIAERFHGQIFPPVTAYAFYGEGEMWKNYLRQGHGDFTPFYTAARAIDFYRNIGGHERVLSYCRPLISEAADLLVMRLGTWHYPLPEGMQTSLMRLVALPKLSKYPPVIVPPNEVRRKIHDMVQLNNDVWKRFGILCAFVSVENEAWIRICVSIYNELHDYEKLADAILTLVEEDKLLQK